MTDTRASHAPLRSAGRTAVLTEQAQQAEPAGTALDGPGSVTVSCLLMQDAVSADVVSVATGTGKVALFANPYLDGKEEALVVDQEGHLTYLGRTDSTTGWEQADVTGGGAETLTATEVVVVVHPQDRTLWALYSSATGAYPRLRALRLVGDTTQEGAVTSWSWRAEPSAIATPGGDGVDGLSHLYTYYDGRTPVVFGYDAGSSRMAVVRPSTTGPSRFATWTAGTLKQAAGAVDDLAGGYVTPEDRGTPPAPVGGNIVYVRRGRNLSRHSSSAGAAVPIAPDATELVGVYRPYGRPDLGCLYLDGSGNLVTWNTDGTPNGKYTYTGGLGLRTADAWVDVDGMVHVYGLAVETDGDGVETHTLKVLHQVSWEPGGAPGWSRAAVPSSIPLVPVDPAAPKSAGGAGAARTAPHGAAPVPTCIGLVPKVAFFALDPFPDSLPSQLVKREGVATPSDQFSIHTQDITSARWSRDKIRLAPQDGPDPVSRDPHLVSHYVSSVTVLDGRGTPMPAVTVQISAETLVEIQVDGASYLVGPGYHARLATNSLGRITVATPADSLLPATLHVDVIGLAKGAIIQPASAVHEYLAGTGTLPSRQGLFDAEALRTAEADGRPLVAPEHEGSVDHVVNGTKQVFKVASGQPLTSRLFRGAGPAPHLHGFAVGSAPGHARAAGAGGVAYSEFTTPDQARAHLEGIRARPEYGGIWDDFVNWAGDVWEGIKNGAIEVYEVAVHAVTSVFVWVGEKIVELVGFAIDTVESAVHAVEAVIREVVDAVSRVVDWLKALFDFKDIWDTKRALESGMGMLLSYGSATLEHFGSLPGAWFESKEAEVKQYFDGLRSRYAGRPLGDAGNQVPAITDASGSTATPQDLRGNPQATWLLDQAMGSRVMAAAGGAPSPVRADSAIFDAFTAFVGDLRKTRIDETALEVLGDLGAVVAQVVDAADPELAGKASMTALIDTLEKLINAVLAMLDAVVKAVVALVKAVATNLTEVLGAQPPGLMALNTLYRWIQTSGGVEEEDVEDITLGGLISLVAGFAVTTVHKLVNGVDRAPFPGGWFPVVPAPPWHPQYDPRAGSGADDPAFNASMRDLQLVAGSMGLVGALFDVAADLMPLGGDAVPDLLQVGVAAGSSLCTATLFGVLGSCPPVMGIDWEEGGGRASAAFGVATTYALACLATVGAQLAGYGDTPILKNIADVTLGPITACAASALVVFLAIPADGDVDPYATTQIALAGVPGMAQMLRYRATPKQPGAQVRAGIVAVVDGLAQATSSSMLLAAAARSEVVVPSQQPHLLPGSVGAPYTATLVAEGGGDPFNEPLRGWTVDSGSLPAGLSLAPSGVISGTPTKAGRYTFTVTVSNSFKPPQYASPTALTLTVG
ncbi:hypothetical protein RVR_4161 [Actinacidiphila reveromycinica]|uniref:Uncharacterized protein n=1 Tax=Actinacidiphila reveromycinica TaxID=659352 RepID=A0A7U3VNZ9_9ACTN|nr:Ig domain-containing protein [Streptomyces sp. SN-593]BBA98104.1 hypothetical protein RVR_4161 [Streptomyces sp. SN-593]